MSTLPSHDGKVQLYAEFHLNISRVTLFVSLKLKGRLDDRAYISSDGHRVRVEYDEHEAAIVFPNGVKGKATAHIPVTASALLSANLEITEKNSLTWGNVLQNCNDRPWTSARIDRNTAIACRYCCAILLSCDSHLVWKDLPREDWAEFMEFWHCHRPLIEDPRGSRDERSAHINTVYIREVDPHIGYIDEYSFIVHQSVCRNVQIKSLPLNESIHCVACNAEVGVRDGALNGYRLHKWNVSVKREPPEVWEQNSLQKIISERLLAAVDSQATRKILLRAAFASEVSFRTDHLLLWILNADIRYCASRISSGNPHRAVKVLYQDIEDASIEKMFNNNNDGSIELPSIIIQEIRSDLIKSNEILPETARKCQGLNVGFLDRFESSQVC